METRTEWYAGVVTALSSISHISPEPRAQTTKSYFRREKIVQPNGTVEHVPVVSGNGMRGLLRDRGMYHMCETLGFAGLSLPAFHFLFSGGSLTSVGGRALDVTQARRVRELIPLVGLFGGAMGNQIMDGKLKVGKMIPICEETKHLLPSWCVDAETVRSVYDLMQEETFTRKDDQKNERLRLLVAPDIRALLEESATAKREKALAGEKKPDDDVGQHQQMRYEVETLAAGTKFFWELALEEVTAVEYDAFWTTMAQFAKWPYIGGKSGTGHGKVALNLGEDGSWRRIDPRIAAAESLPDVPIGTRYADHLREHGAEIVETLVSWQ